MGNPFFAYPGPPGEDRELPPVDLFSATGKHLPLMSQVSADFLTCTTSFLLFPCQWKISRASISRLRARHLFLSYVLSIHIL